MAESPDVPLCGADGYEFMDLLARRYLVQGLHSQEPTAPTYTTTTLTPDDFTPDALRRAGRR